MSKVDKRSYFEVQRDLLLGKISTNMESVLSNLNTLNRSLEDIVAVGKEFENVAQLWQNFSGDLERPGNDTSDLGAASSTRPSEKVPDVTANLLDAGEDVQSSDDVEMDKDN